MKTFDIHVHGVICRNICFTNYCEWYISVLRWLKDQPPLTVEELSTLFITMQDFETALKHVQPSAKREGFATIPDVTWDDIGALQNIREELHMAILVSIARIPFLCFLSKGSVYGFGRKRER